LPILFVSRVFPALSFTICKILGLILRSLIHFELILVQGDRHGSSFNFLQADKHFFPATFVEEAVYLHHMFLTPLSKIRWA
jgi:hypothetical protein